MGAAPGVGGSGVVDEGVSSDGLKAWVAERAPLLHHCLSTFMHTRCFLYGDARSQGVGGRCGGDHWPGHGCGMFVSARVCEVAAVVECLKREEEMGGE